jgi:predicted  nucleic acid-binding Zn-ribbon protein
MERNNPDHDGLMDRLEAAELERALEWRGRREVEIRLEAAESALADTKKALEAAERKNEQLSALIIEQEADYRERKQEAESALANMRKALHRIAYSAGGQFELLATAREIARAALADYSSEPEEPHG